MFLWWQGASITMTNYINKILTDFVSLLYIQTFLLRNIYVNFIENHNTSLKIVIVDGFILSIKRHLQFSHHYFIIIFVSVSTKPTRAYCMSNFYNGGTFCNFTSVSMLTKLEYGISFYFLNSIWICIFNCFKFLIVLAKYQYEISFFKLLNLVV